MTRYTTLFSFLLLLLALFLTDVTASESELSTITVHGQGELKVPADQMRMELAVISHAASAKEALQDNADKMKRTVRAIERHGLAASEFQTGQFQVQPVWEPRPRHAPDEWRPRIINYTVTNSLLIKTRKLEVVPELIEACIKAGVNDIDALSFDLADPRTSRAEVIAQATKSAITDAETLASSAGVRIARIQSLNLDHADAVPIRSRSKGYAEAMILQGDAAPPVTPGLITLRADVRAVFVLSNNGRMTQ